VTTPTIQREWRYNIGRVSTHWGFYPIFNWSFELRLDHNSPLSACSQNGKLIWQWNEDDPIELDSVEAVVELLVALDLPKPPHLEEVFAIMQSHRRELEESTDNQTRQEIFIEIHDSWKRFMSSPFDGRR
jgi:hypothetical protein